MSKFKSWWYWNVSSKYDSLDLFVYTGFPLLIAAVVFLAAIDADKRSYFKQQCESKGGVLISTQRGHHCIDKQAWIQLEDNR